MKNLQDQFAPNSICFGCGPANHQGLQIKSLPVDENSTEATFQPADFHQAFPGMINGGIIGTLLDCHSNWTAAWHLMNRNSLAEPPCTVTASFSVKLLRPTPSGSLLKMTAQVKVSTHDRATISSELIANDKVCATCEGVFVAVKEGHPAYHRWG